MQYRDMRSTEIKRCSQDMLSETCSPREIDFPRGNYETRMQRKCEQTPLFKTTTFVGRLLVSLFPSEQLFELPRFIVRTQCAHAVVVELEVLGRKQGA